VDANSDGFADWVFVGDNNGRLWQLNAGTGENPFGPAVALYNAGNDDPIATSPAVAVSGGEVVLFFGTGGTDWAPADAAHLHKLIAVKAGFHHADAGQGVGEVLFSQALPAGEKVFSSPVLSGTVLYLGTVVGTVESADPTQDLPAVGATVGSLRAYNVGNAVGGLGGAPTVAGTVAGAGNVRATLHIQNDALYGATIDGQVVQVGTAGNGGNTSIPPVDRFFWRQVE
jgi:outer membrane protein assembly factor BamB